MKFIEDPTQFDNISSSVVSALIANHQRAISIYNENHAIIRIFTYIFTGFGVVGHCLIIFTVMRYRDFRSLFYRLLVLDSVFEAVTCVGFSLLAKANYDFWGCSLINRPGRADAFRCDDFPSAFMLSISRPALAQSFKEHATTVQILMLIDRLVAVCFPIFYTNHMSVRKQLITFKCITVSLAVGFPLLYWVLYYDPAINQHVSTNITQKAYLIKMRRFGNVHLKNYYRLVHKYLAIGRDLTMIVCSIVINSAVVIKLSKQSKTSLTSRNQLKQHRRKWAMVQMMLITTGLTVLKCIADICWAWIKNERTELQYADVANNPKTERSQLEYFYWVQASVFTILNVRDVFSIVYALNFYTLVAFNPTFRKAFLHTTNIILYYSNSPRMIARNRGEYRERARSVGQIVHRLPKPNKVISKDPISV